MLQRTLPTLAVVLAAAFAAPPAYAETAHLSFEAAADTYVASSYPTTSYWTSSSLYVQGTSTRQAFLRFNVDGIGGRHVTRARLRLYSRRDAAVGATVFSVGSTDWSETMTWNTRPSVDGPSLGSVGAATINTYYDIELSPEAITADRLYSFALTSTSKSSSQWASREAATGIPRLILDVEADGWVIDGLLPIAGPLVGSGNATAFAGNHRLAETASGRVLTVHGRHGSGVQLAWRDPAGYWQTHSRGGTLDGSLLTGTNTGDWPSSIAVARDSGGSEHAWVVMSASSASKVRPVYVRRLSELDNPEGPVVGPLVVIDAPARGAFQPDIEFGTAPDGTTRGALTWVRRVGDSAYEQVAAWLDSLDTDTPAAADVVVTGSGTSSGQRGTFVDHGGMRLVSRTTSSKLALRTYDYANRTWTTGASGMTFSGHLSAVGLGDQVVAVAETSTSTPTLRVQRFSAAGAPLPYEITLAGYRSPTLTTDGSALTLLMVRTSDGSLVSRTRVAGGPWPSTDTVEVPGAMIGGSALHPNAIRRNDGRLQLVFAGPGASGRSSVYGFSR